MGTRARQDMGQKHELVVAELRLRIAHCLADEREGGCTGGLQADIALRRHIHNVHYAIIAMPLVLNQVWSLMLATDRITLRRRRARPLM